MPSSAFKYDHEMSTATCLPDRFEAHRLGPRLDLAPLIGARCVGARLFFDQIDSDPMDMDGSAAAAV